MQILVRLPSKAVKFTPEGGVIGLDLTGDTVREMAQFTVWNTGIGIAPQNTPKWFKPFVQLDRALAGGTPAPVQSCRWRRD